MATGKELIQKYVTSTSAKRVDFIIKYYADFMGIVEGYTDGLQYMIECDKECNARQNMGDLGVRVQTGGMTGDPTAKHAIRNILTREALVKCDFSDGVMDGVDRAAEYMSDAYILKDMRKHFNLFNRQLIRLGKGQEEFKLYISREKNISELAEVNGVTYETEQWRLNCLKKKLKEEVVGYLEGKMGGIA